MATANTSYPLASQYPAIVGVDPNGRKRYVRVDSYGVLATGTSGYHKSDLAPYDGDSPSPIRKIYVGGTGNLYAKCSYSGESLTFLNVPNGETIEGPFSQVTTSSTTTSMIGFYDQNAIVFVPAWLSSNEPLIDSDGNQIIFID